jgi:hypothetical protein
MNSLPKGPQAPGNERAGTGQFRGLKQSGPLCQVLCPPPNLESLVMTRRVSEQVRARLFRESDFADLITVHDVVHMPSPK